MVEGGVCKRRLLHLYRRNRRKFVERREQDRWTTWCVVLDGCARCLCALADDYDSGGECGSRCSKTSTMECSECRSISNAILCVTDSRADYVSCTLVSLLHYQEANQCRDTCGDRYRSG